MRTDKTAHQAKAVTTRVKSPRPTAWKEIQVPGIFLTSTCMLWQTCPPPLTMLKMKVLNEKGREHGDPVENMRVVLSTLSKKSTFHTDWVL